MWRPVQSAARYCSPQVLDFIEHDKPWCNPDQIDRDVRHGQLLKTMMMDVCMFPHWHIAGDRELTWLGGESRVNCSA